jgi:predicted transcriptional regulator
MKKTPPPLSRRERQILDALHAEGEADVEAVRGRLDDAPGYDSVRTILRILEEKGHVKSRREGRKLIYRAAQSRPAALRAAWNQLVGTFFDGSHDAAAATLLRASDPDLNEKKLAALLAEIDDVKRKKGGS